MLRAMIRTPWRTNLSARLGGALLVLSSLAGCAKESANAGSSAPITDARELQPFDRLVVEGAFEVLVHVQPGAQARLELTGDAAQRELVTLSVSDAVLTVAPPPIVVRPSLQPVRIEIWAPSLLGLRASGATKVAVEGLAGERFEVALLDASHTSLSGAVDRLEAALGDATQLDARGLQATDVDLKAKDASKALVWASGVLDVTVSDAAAVIHHGHPAEIRQATKDAGSLKPGD